MTATIKVGVIGCGTICPHYFQYARQFAILDIAACADLDPARAKARAEEFHVPRACSVQEILADPEIQIILNLTVPKAHTAVNLAAIDAGKHVYCEKPLALSRQEALKTLGAAKARGVRVGCAPDTFLGGGIQTCRKLIDDGWIGTPIGATAAMTNHGHESWHPAPQFYYEEGGGPMFDMGPYYLTALVNLIGPIRRVTGSSRITFPERTITSAPLAGTRIKVQTPTHLAGVVDFAGGAIGTVLMTFDVWAANLPRIEIYGSEGSLGVPDPNCFDGPVLIRRPGHDAWQEVPLTHSGQTGRGIGLADMAHGILSGRPHRASGEMASHVVDVMESFDEASRAGRHIEIQSQCDRPAPLPLGLLPGMLDD